MNAHRVKIDFERLATQAEKRLDLIFKQPAVSSGLKVATPLNTNSIVNRLDRLHKILLSIELRDTDELIIKYFKQLEYLKKIFEQDKYLRILITLQCNLSHYIQTNKKNAHPIAFKILRSAFNRMCDIFYAKNLKRNDRVKIINKEIIQYNQFHQLIKNRERAVRHQQVKGVLKRGKNSFGKSETADQKRDQVIRERLMLEFYIMRALADLKSYIHSELEKLRAEIQANTAKNGV